MRIARELNRDTHTRHFYFLLAKEKKSEKTDFHHTITIPILFYRESKPFFSLWTFDFLNFLPLKIFRELG